MEEHPQGKTEHEGGHSAGDATPHIQNLRPVHHAHRAVGTGTRRTNSLRGHFGVDKTLNRLTQDFYWPNMRADCEKLCEECNICNMAKDKNVPPPPPARSIQAPTRPGVIVQMDLQGPVHSRKHGKNSYLLGIIDTFSKHLTLRLIKGKKAEDVVPQMYKYCLALGIPKQISTDRGTDFNNSPEKEMCNRLGIQLLVTASYHAQSNGLAEEANKTVQNYIRKARATHDKEPSNFEDFLLPLHLSYNTAYSNGLIRYQRWLAQRK